MSDLKTLRDQVKAALDAYDAVPLPHAHNNWNVWKPLQRKAVEDLRAAVEAAGLRVRDGGNAKSVRGGGFSASSTVDLVGACRNWLGGADRRLQP